MDREEQRRRMRERTARSAANTKATGLGRKTVLDLTVVGDRTIDQYRMKGGVGIKNALDILPYEITQDWYKDMREPSGAPTGLAVGDSDYKLEYGVHKRQGENQDTVLCLRLTFGRQCPMCEPMQTLWGIDKAKRTIDQQKMLDFLKPSWRCSYNVFDYDEPAKNIQLWDDQSYKLFEELLKLRIQTDPEGLQAFSDLETGLIVEFEGVSKTLGTNTKPFYEAAQFAFLQRSEPWPYETLQETFPLDQMLPIPTYNEVAAIFNSLEAPPDMDGYDDQQPTAGTRSRGDAGGGRSRDDAQPGATQCSGGHTLGKDYNQFENCNACDEQEYQQCADLNRPDGDTADSPGDGSQPWTPGQSDAPADNQPATNTRSRTREADAGGDQPATGQRTRGRQDTQPPADPGTRQRVQRTRG
ncbi:hypothetical protein LCGC14_0569520 [marine sediment metagenome]|uniref:Bacteriophage T4 Gp32 single-stranded DNA-binding domain-containing protein n=1 Tax=marine sediment metagenome TaxID=412755 RepID=A0A0F9USV1_9ZZZZ